MRGDRFRFGTGGNGICQVVLQDAVPVFFRGWRVAAHGNRGRVPAALPASEHPTPASLNRLAHEYSLKDELRGAWTVRPLELVREHGRTILVLEDSGGEPLAR